MKKIREYLTCNNVLTRIVSTFILMLILFIFATVLSYYFLPEGFLLNKNSIADFEVSNDIIFGALQIFGYNMISVVVIILGSIFSNKKNEHDNYLSYGYIGLFILVIMNGITLGTWSFTDNSVSVPLFNRMISMFNILEHAGLVEMIGQMFICTSIANHSLVKVWGKNVKTNKLKELKFQKVEVVILALGFVLMFIGALIESNAIV